MWKCPNCGWTLPGRWIRPENFERPRCARCGYRMILDGGEVENE